jgi:hypothetical protein
MSSRLGPLRALFDGSGKHHPAPQAGGRVLASGRHEVGRSPLA